MKIKILFKSALALVVALACANALCSVYYNAPGTLNRDAGSTKWMWLPNTKCINAYEGYGITHFDKNGYCNENKELAESYVLLMGSSHVEGTHVSDKDKMNYQLNKLMGGEDKLKVYSIACAGHYFQDICRGFYAATKEYPNTSAIVIELFKTDFSEKELENSLQRSEYDPKSTAQNLYENRSTVTKIKNMISSYFPYFTELKNKQFLTADFELDLLPKKMKNEKKNEEKINMVKYVDTITEMLSTMRAEYDKPIIVLYHPYLVINKDGKMVIQRETESYEIFSDLCKKNGVTFVDVGDDFVEEYNKHNIIPYGFNNTSMGTGHLNKYGHKIIAERIYETLKKLGVETE